MKRLLAAATLAVIFTAGCSSSVDNPPDVGPTTPTSGNGNPAGANPPPATGAATAALFQPAQGIFPFPNDLYFSGTTDGTINIQPVNALIPQQVGLNALDGWSTTAPIRVNFGGPINAASLNAQTVRVYQVTTSNTNKAVTGFTRALVFGTDFIAGMAPDTGVGALTLEIRPLIPLVPSSGATSVGYLVVLTNGITMASGATATADRDYALIKTALGPTVNPAGCATLTGAPMQGACGFTASHFAVAANPALGAAAVNPANIIVSFHFSTQATRDTMNALGQIITLVAPPPAIVVAPGAGTPLNLINPALPSIVNARFGTVTVPYYSYIPTPQAPGGISTDSTILRRAWTAAAAPPAPLTDPANERNLTRFNPVPALVANKAIPLVVTVPNATAPGGAGVKPGPGWPVVIFQHGITGDRSQSLALAGAFAQAGWAVAAIDLPLHGIVSTTSPLYQASNEQTFNLDLVVNATGATGPDSVIDTSGTHFINLPYPLASRDNLRQAAVNLLALRRALPTLDLDGDGTTVDIDANRIAFVGMSLGSITGIVFGGSLPNPSPLKTMAFSVPGGGIAQLLRDSASFGPRINAGLQAQGLIPNTTLYNQFFRDAQAIVDAGDSLNYIATTAARHTIYFSQVVGAATPPPNPDQVIPNSATQRLITAIGGAGIPFPRRTTGTNLGSGYVNFIAGDHGSLLSPAASVAATVEMQTQIATFTAAGNQPGGVSTPIITVTNTAVVQQ
jgi:hypothetical protein